MRFFLNAHSVENLCCMKNFDIKVFIILFRYRKTTVMEKSIFLEPVPAMLLNDFSASGQNMI